MALVLFFAALALASEDASAQLAEKQVLTLADTPEHDVEIAQAGLAAITHETVHETHR